MRKVKIEVEISLKGNPPYITSAEVTRVIEIQGELTQDDLEEIEENYSLYIPKSLLNQKNSEVSDGRYSG